jgi:1-acyl-sn-glycerol-3-phosphate acyltransferase
VKRVATVWYWLVFLPTASFGVLLLALFRLVTSPLDPDARWSHTFLSWWTHQYLKAWPGWRVRVIGEEKLPKTACVLVANHQSAMDVVACLGLRHSFKFVSKASLKKVPIIGLAMRLARYVFVERGELPSTRRMVEQSRGWLKSGISLLVFPEGTYSGGHKLLPFKRGAFSLAISEQVPLVPVVLRGTTDVVFEDGPWMGTKALVSIEVLDPILPATFGDNDSALAERVRLIFKERLRQ